ncbi:winged helix-turn-helix transcriptional regulator [Curvivirga sp.]|uniref:winged helix-turn-helix transcriptional regulator n=1 Tax=Curvivirga sp. TaxID=2856848 RepID=UPI003B5CE28E
MTRKSTIEWNCSWARAAEVFGDKWSLLIIKNAFMGVRSFSGFAESLGISRNILSSRLEHLVTYGVLEKTPKDFMSKQSDYKLTGKGEDLIVMMIAIGQWGDKYHFDNHEIPIQIRDTQSGEEVSILEASSKDGRVLSATDITFEPGPGANEETRALLHSQSQL